VAVKFEHGFDYALVWRVAAGAALVILVIVWWNRKLSAQPDHPPGPCGTGRASGQLRPGLFVLRSGRRGAAAPQPRMPGHLRPGPGREALHLLLFPGIRRGRELSKNIGRILAEPDEFRRSCTSRSCPGRSGSGIELEWNTGLDPAGSC
jgi:hypothetical protein